MSPLSRAKLGSLCSPPPLLFLFFGPHSGHFWGSAGSVGSADHPFPALPLCVTTKKLAPEASSPSSSGARALATLALLFFSLFLSSLSPSLCSFGSGFVLPRRRCLRRPVFPFFFLFLLVVFVLERAIFFLLLTSSFYGVRVSLFIYFLGRLGIAYLPRARFSFSFFLRVLSL